MTIGELWYRLGKEMDKGNEDHTVFIQNGSSVEWDYLKAESIEIDNEFPVHLDEEGDPENMPALLIQAE
jgi:hypothetical protein